MTNEILTDRLQLRAVVHADAGDIYAYTRNPSVLRYTTGTPPQSLAETESFVETLVKKPDGAHAWAIRLRDEPAVIGVIEFGTGDGVTGSVDYALAEEHWNRGLMTEAVRAVLDWGFRAYPALARVESAAMTANPASTRVQQKCGMRLERTENHTWKKSPEPVEVAICAITRDEWMHTRADASPVCVIRPETAADFDAIRRLIVPVFTATYGSGKAEADLVEQARQHPACAPVVSLVALIDDVVIGHVLFSAVQLANHPAVSVCALGPLGVHGSHQRRGIGSQLIRRGLEMCRTLGYRAVFVQGSFDYYPRFGFVPLRETQLETNFQSDHDMVLELEPGLVARLGGMVDYPEPWHVFL